MISDGFPTDSNGYIFYRFPTYPDFQRIHRKSGRHFQWIKLVRNPTEIQGIFDDVNLSKIFDGFLTTLSDRIQSTLVMSSLSLNASWYVKCMKLFLFVMVCVLRVCNVC